MGIFGSIGDALTGGGSSGGGSSGGGAFAWLLVSEYKQMVSTAARKRPR